MTRVCVHTFPYRLVLQNAPIPFLPLNVDKAKRQSQDLSTRRYSAVLRACRAKAAEETQHEDEEDD
jgi:hypothetical protein